VIFCVFSVDLYDFGRFFILLTFFLTPKSLQKPEKWGEKNENGLFSLRPDRWALKN